MLPWLVCGWKVFLEQKNIDFDSAKEFLMKTGKEMFKKRRFKRIYNMMEYKLYMRREEIFENKEIFIYGIKHFETKKVETYILIECESDEIYEIDKLFIFWFKKIIIKEVKIKKNRDDGVVFL